MDIFALIGFILILFFNFLMFVRKINRPWYLAWGLAFVSLSMALYHPIPIYQLLNFTSLVCVVIGALREPP